MSPEARPTPQTSHEIKAHEQSVREWANRLSDDYFTPTLDGFDELTAAADSIEIGTTVDNKGVEHASYVDDEQNPIKKEAAEKVLDASKEAYWHVSPEDVAATESITKAGSPRELAAQNPDAYKLFERYCARTGQAKLTPALVKFTALRHQRLAFSNALEKRAADKEAGVEDAHHDELVRRVARLVTQVLAADASAPDKNLDAYMDSTAPDGSKHSVRLTDRQLEQIEDLAPEIEAGIALRSPSPTEREDEAWLRANKAEIISRNRVSYMLNGQNRPLKGWKSAEEDRVNERARDFDTFTDEQKLGIESLPNGEPMPAPMLLRPPVEDVHYGRPVPPKKSMFGRVKSALIGKTSREVSHVLITGLAGPVVSGLESDIQALTGRRARSERAYTERKANELISADAKAKDAHARKITEADGLQADMERGYELQRKLQDIHKRSSLQEAKRELGIAALEVIMKGHDPSRDPDLLPILQSQRLRMTDILPNFDLDRHKRYKK